MTEIFDMNKRDYREETALNAAEYRQLQYLAGRLGLSKRATLRYCFLQVADKVTRQELARDTAEVSED